MMTRVFRSAPLPPLPGLDPDAARPVVMGIVNVSDDSFSGDSLKGDAGRAIQQARAQVAAGAAMVDLGAESTRPGAAPVSVQQEIDRLLPVLEGLRDLGKPVSVDTRHAATMRAVAAAGAAILNDISALEGEGSLAAAAASGLPIVLMHMQGEPGTMQSAPQYDDVVAEVLAYLESRIAACAAAGIARAKIILDPGIGFGKTVAHNLALLRALPRFHGLGCPLLIGVSRKSFIGAIAHEPDPARRLPGSLAVALHAATRGAAILRVHDVPETVQALALWHAISGPESGGNPAVQKS
ncbi:dihydropteroate synthase [Ferrovibrio xuzhouensis]|uniref:dihydropteroate synthase n=1 Tax=Ferrovibrio xuzhouensis TaxID=1576914 RepID=A0ABV7VAQ6_9PROT